MPIPHAKVNAFWRHGRYRATFRRFIQLPDIPSERLLTNDPFAKRAPCIAAAKHLEFSSQSARKMGYYEFGAPKRTHA